MNETLRKILRVAIPIVLLLLAIGVAVVLLITQPEAERAEPREERVLVETERVEAATHRLNVDASGTVVAARDVNVQPQVSGRIIEVHDQLVPGGIVREGEVLFRIDPSDYRLAVEEQQTALEEAQAALEQERGRQEVAEREWELFEEEVEERGMIEEGEDPSLALREPQLQSAQVAVEAARARLERARLDLERTTVEVPFDAFVETEAADVGQTVGTQTQVARLVGTDTFWVRLAVPVDRIPYIEVPGVNADGGSPVLIEQDVGARTVERQGRVARLMGDLDEAGRMAQVLVAIDDPFGVAELQEGEAPEEAPRGIPLLLNSYVDVEIEGPTVDGLIEVPRDAVREGDQVFVYDEGRLAVRDVDVAWSRDETLLIQEGLADGDQVITSPIATPIEGMRLRTAQQPNDNADDGRPRDDAGGERRDD